MIIIDVVVIPMYSHLEHEVASIVLIFCGWLKVKWFKGPSEREMVQVHEVLNKIKFVANKLHRSLVIQKTVEDDEGKYWCQVGKHKCCANYRFIRK